MLSDKDRKRHEHLTDKVKVIEDGSTEKTFLGIVDLNNALTLADTDIKENWERYKERCLGRIKS